MKLNNCNNIRAFIDNKVTVESVLQGHPDKVCDQICDSILDSFIEVDEHAKTAIECLGTGNSLFIGGEVFSDANIDIADIVGSVYKQIGYTEKLLITNKISQQSEQLRRAISTGAAGDQGVMYGFACKSNYNFLPFCVYAVNTIAKEIDLLRNETGQYLPDGKVQLTMNGENIDTLVINIQHNANADLVYLEDIILKRAVANVLPIDNIKRVYFNNKSSFINGGFANDTGLSGRKIIVDTYCGLIPHGGGPFSGKDPTKVDRSAAYMARFVAKNIVANELADTCLVSVAYVFGEEDPVMIGVQTDNINNSERIRKLIKKHFDFRPAAIIERLQLTKTRFRQTATYGHFLNSDYNWEQVISL